MASYPPNAGPPPVEKTNDNGCIKGCLLALCCCCCLDTCEEVSNHAFRPSSRRSNRPVDIIARYVASAVERTMWPASTASPPRIEIIINFVYNDHHFYFTRLQCCIWCGAYRCSTEYGQRAYIKPYSGLGLDSRVVRSHLRLDQYRTYWLDVTGTLYGSKNVESLASSSRTCLDRFSQA
jgi:hypothetical protein